MAAKQAACWPGLDGPTSSRPHLHVSVQPCLPGSPSPLPAQQHAPAELAFFGVLISFACPPPAQHVQGWSAWSCPSTSWPSCQRPRWPPPPPAASWAWAATRCMPLRTSSRRCCWGACQRCRRSTWGTPGSAAQPWACSATRHSVQSGTWSLLARPLTKTRGCTGAGTPPTANPATTAARATPGLAAPMPPAGEHAPGAATTAAVLHCARLSGMCVAAQPSLCTIDKPARVKRVRATNRRRAPLLFQHARAGTG